ncbi:hypothetical protein MTO96_040852 [Rhipicephalus appendiculatus]
MEQTDSTSSRDQNLPEQRDIPALHQSPVVDGMMESAAPCEVMVHFAPIMESRQGGLGLRKQQLSSGRKSSLHALGSVLQI